jgi:thiamine-monophosphate kinase
MKNRRLSERELIADLEQRFRSSDNRVILGIGDDAAVIRPGGAPLVLTKDMLVEDVHFFPDHPPELLGRKSLSVNLSDLAAMGARPRFALFGLGLPEDYERSWVDRYFNGLEELAARYDVSLIGGDITASSKVTVSLTLIGEGRRITPRSGARPGDAIYVSGNLGDAAQGLHLAGRGVLWGADRSTDLFLKAFLDPVPRVDLGLKLTAHNAATAMIDISDGLSVDLGHICEASGTGAEVDAASLPISAELRRASPYAEALALHGGEDYQLLFTVAPDTIESLTRIQLGCKITRIGSILEGPDMVLMDAEGRREPLEPHGFQHFHK